MARKVFISFLGTSPYGECIYSRGEFRSQKVRFIQEATLRYHFGQSPWSEGDAAYILLTPLAETKNWFDDGQTNRDGIKIEWQGLKSRLDAMSLPFVPATLNNLPDGNKEQEIMEIFMRVFDVLQDGDELYFDITHGYRYLPMLSLVLGNYAKFLKKVTVKSITYGNYEARDKATNIAPIIDLTMLSDLQDWTHAAADFIENGSPEKMVALAESDLKPILKEAKGGNKVATETKRLSNLLIPYAHDFHTCRGINIYHGTNVKPLKAQLAVVEEVLLEPMNPVIDKLRADVASFSDSPSADNCFKAAWWCYERGLYQQAVTFLEEAAISFFCLRHSIPIDDVKQRELVTKAAYCLKNSVSEPDWNVEEEFKPSVRELCFDKLLSDRKMIEAYFAVVSLRNDVNHCGFRPNPMPSKRIIDNIKAAIETIEHLLNDPSHAS